MERMIQHVCVYVHERYPALPVPKHPPSYDGGRWTQNTIKPFNLYNKTNDDFAVDLKKNKGGSCTQGSEKVQGVTVIRTTSEETRQRTRAWVNNFQIKVRKKPKTSSGDASWRSSVPERTQESAGIGHDLNGATDKSAVLAIVSVSGGAPRAARGCSPLVARGFGRKGRRMNGEHGGIGGRGLT